MVKASITHGHQATEPRYLVITPRQALELLSLKATELAAAVRQMQSEMRSASISGSAEAAGAAAGAQRQRLSALCLELLSVLLPSYHPYVP